MATSTSPSITAPVAIALPGDSLEGQTMFHSTIRLDLSFDQSAAAFVSALMQCGIVFTGRQEGNELILTLTGY